MNHVHTPGIFVHRSDPPLYDCATCGIRYMPSRQADITIYGESVWNDYEEAWDEEVTVAEEESRRKDTAINELSEALRLTAEYYDSPATEGWAWYDALIKWNPRYLDAWTTPTCLGPFCRTPSMFRITSEGPGSITTEYACDEHVTSFMPLNTDRPEVTVERIRNE